MFASKLAFLKYLILVFTGVCCDFSFENRFKQLLNLNYDYISNQSIPGYMLDKYKQAQNGFNLDYPIFCTPGLSINSNLFIFNLTGFNLNQINGAEFHVFRPENPTKNNYILRIYQIENENLENPDLHQLLNVRYFNLNGLNDNSSGWEVFNTTKTVETWLNNPKTNHGIYITATSIKNDQINIKFQQSLLIIFGAKYKNPTKPVINSNLSCRREVYEIPLHIKNIIQPRKYPAFKCAGVCDKSAVFASNHAKLFDEDSHCVPDNFLPFLVLYYDGNFIILRNIPDAVVATCACR